MATFFPLLLGNVVIQTEHADDFTLTVVQGYLGSAQPDCLAIRRGLGFFEIEPSLAGLHDSLVVGAIQVGLRSPTHGVVVLADQFSRALLAGIARKGWIAAQVAAFPVFPEDADRRGVDDLLQQVA